MDSVHFDACAISSITFVGSVSATPSVGISQIVANTATEIDIFSNNFWFIAGIFRASRAEVRVVSFYVPYMSAGVNVGLGCSILQEVGFGGDNRSFIGTFCLAVFRAAVVGTTAAMKRSDP